MKYYGLTGKGKEIIGVIRYDKKRESTAVWRDEKWQINNNLFSYVMGDGGAIPITAAKAQEVIRRRHGPGRWTRKRAACHRRNGTGPRADDRGLLR